jgi:hypothetical protein
VFVDPPTVAVNCRVCEAARMVEVGETEIVTTGTRVITAFADLVVSAVLVVVISTVC